MIKASIYLLTSSDSKTDRETENVTMHVNARTMTSLNSINYTITKEISHTMTAMHSHESNKC